MTTEKKSTVAEKKPGPARKTQVKKTQYGIAELAKTLGVKPQTVRIKLRKAKIKREGKSYNWTTLEAVKKVANQLSAAA